MNLITRKHDYLKHCIRMITPGQVWFIETAHPCALNKQQVLQHLSQRCHQNYLSFIILLLWLDGTR